MCGETLISVVKLCCEVWVVRKGLLDIILIRQIKRKFHICICIWYVNNDVLGEKLRHRLSILQKSIEFLFLQALETNSILIMTMAFVRSDRPEGWLANEKSFVEGEDVIRP